MTTIAQRIINNSKNLKQVADKVDDLALSGYHIPGPDGCNVHLFEDDSLIALRYSLESSDTSIPYIAVNPHRLSSIKRYISFLGRAAWKVQNETSNWIAAIVLRKT